MKDKLAELKSRAQKVASRTDGLVAVDASTLLSIIAALEETQADSKLFRVEVLIKRTWRALYGPFSTRKEAIAEAVLSGKRNVRVVQERIRVVWTYEGKTTD